MKRFVLDNSVTMRWLLASMDAKDQAYAECVLRSLSDADAVVPGLWHLEVVNVLMVAERKDHIVVSEVEGFLSQLEALPIETDPLTSRQSFNRILSLSRAYGLSSYDAAYLELAVREGLALASLDKALVKAAGQAGVAIYQE